MVLHIDTLSDLKRKSLEKQLKTGKSQKRASTNCRRCWRRSTRMMIPSRSAHQRLAWRHVASVGEKNWCIASQGICSFYATIIPLRQNDAKNQKRRQQDATQALRWGFCMASCGAVQSWLP